MPGMDGIEATAAIVRVGLGEPGVLILTTFDLDQYVIAGLRAGASGFLLKDTQPDDLLAAIRTVAGGDASSRPAPRGVSSASSPARCSPEHRTR